MAISTCMDTQLASLRIPFRTTAECRAIKLIRLKKLRDSAVGMNDRLDNNIFVSTSPLSLSGNDVKVKRTKAL